MNSIGQAPVIPVSIIICARNEARNLAENLPQFLTQQYHSSDNQALYEVIVVNDASSDTSREVLEGIAQTYPGLRVVDISASEIRKYPGKKFALSRGVAAAKFEHILLADADCVPASKAWITWMAHPLSLGKEIVAGYGAYYSRPGPLNAFIRCETIHTYLQYLTYNMAGLPYMAVGRNLACRKELLLQAAKHPEWKATASGDDDLLIQLCATADNMTVNVHPASFTWSEAKHTTAEWIRQKQRHLSVGKLYKTRIKWLAGTYGLSHTLFWLCLIMICCFPNYNFHLNSYFFAFLMLSRIIPWLIFSGLSYWIDKRRLKFYWPIFDFGWMLYNLFFAPYILWKNKQQWK